MSKVNPSHEGISNASDVLSGGLLGQEHIEVVLGSDPLEEALSHAIFLV